MDGPRWYLTFGLRRVEGWLHPLSARFISALAEIQRDVGYRGSIGEIGVHQGKLFILLLLTSTEPNGNFAIDIFSEEYHKSNKLGTRNKENFLRNVYYWVGGHTRVSLIERSSLSVHAEEILDMCGPVRLASIDGGHSEECTINDLFLMERVLSPQGIAIIDDCFNQEEPEVATGMARYLGNPNSRLHPFAISPGKVYLTEPGNVEFYRGAISRRFELLKTSRVFGHEVDIYTVRHQKLKAIAKNSIIGPLLIGTKRLLFRVN
jgi:hypothetical protein